MHNLISQVHADIVTSKINYIRYIKQYKHQSVRRYFVTSHLFNAWQVLLL